MATIKSAVCIVRYEKQGSVFFTRGRVDIVRHSSLLQQIAYFTTANLDNEEYGLSRYVKYCG